MKNIYLVRHCKAEGQAADAALTEEGVKQAEQLAGFLSDKHIDYILSSPYERACRSIKPFSDLHNLAVTLDERLTERVLSEKNYPDWREKLRRTFDDLDLSYEGGESSATAMGRAVAVITDVLKSGYENTVIVTHGNLLSLLLHHYDRRFGFNEWQALSNPDVYLISFANKAPAVRRLWV